MAKDGKPALSDARVFSIAFLWLVVLFMIPFGLAMGQPSVSALAGAAGVLGSAALVITAVRRGERQWIRGWAEVMDNSDLPVSGTSEGRCEMELMVEVPRRDRSEELERYAAVISDARVPVDKWPYEGQRLPVRVATTDRNKIEVLWRRVHTEQELAAVKDLVDEYEAEATNLAETRRYDDPPIRQRRPSEPLRPSNGPSNRNGEGNRSGDPVVDTDPISRPNVGAVALLTTSTEVYRPAEQDMDPTRWPIEPVPDMGDGMQAAANDALLGTYRDNAPPGQPGAIGFHYGHPFSVATTDLPRSVSFYRAKFGFEASDNTLMGAKLERGRVSLNLRVTLRVPHIDRTRHFLHLAVDDLPGGFADLQKAGVEFDHSPRVIARAGDMQLLAATCRDLEGHGIALTMWVPFRD